MNEPFDVELSRALKEGAAKSLEGWEFTPAMRAKVLERVSQEQTEPSPAAPPTRRVDPVRWIRPIAWVAAAAAAFVIVANLGGIGKLGGGATKEMSTASAPAADSAKPRAPVDTAAPSTAYSQNQAEPTLAGGNTTQSAPPQPQSLAFGTATLTAAAPVAVELTLPAAPVSGGPEAAATAPVAAPRMTMAAMAATNIGLAANSGGPVLSLTPTGLKAQAPDGTPIWERPLAELNQQSLLAEAPDGRAAVANGANLLYVVGAGGELERTLANAAPIERLTWSGDGRVAVAAGDDVVVYEAGTGNTAFRFEAGANREMAFAPDGLLAVRGDLPNDAHRLVLVDQHGTATVEIRPAAAGRGLAFAAGGDVVVAGGQAYDRVGKPLWQMPLVTEGLTAGEAQVIGWDAHTVLAAGARDGHEIWKADWKGEGAGVRKVVLSPDGRHVAIVAAVDDGALLWLLDSTGKLLYSERLPQMPVDVCFAGNQVVLLMPQSVVFRPIPE